MNPRIIVFVLFLPFFFIIACSQEASLSNENNFKQKINKILKSEDIPELSKIDSLDRVLSAIGNDSLKARSLLKISYHYLKERDSSNFRKFNKEAMELSLQIKDSSSTAAAFWDLGEFYYSCTILDSSYFYYANSQKIYELTKNDDYSARLMLNMAIVQIDISDYTGSEVTTIQAINKLKPLKEYEQLYSAYNNLGIIFKELGNFQKSVGYYEVALSYLLKADREDLLPSIFNNMGVVHQKQGNYPKAKELYYKGLKLQEELQYPDMLAHAKLLDNLAYVKYLSGDTTEVLQDMHKALHIRKELKADSDIIINQLHIADFLLEERADTTSAIQYASQANSLSRKTRNRRDLLASLLMLSSIKKDSVLAYTKEYIAVRDTLEAEERAARNKFARIRFETDEFIAENKNLYSQRNVLVGISLGFALLGLSGLVIKNQRTKNRELSLKQEQQEANEKIFQLLLDQQNIKKASRQKERIRLSEELHDGILAKLFGLRLNLSSLNSQNDRTSLGQREKYLEDLKELGKEIRQLSHELNSPLFTSGTGYLSILEDVLSQNESSFTYQLEVEEEIQWEKISGSIKMHFLRILQEAVRNIQTHSEASFIKVSFELKDNILSYLIQDNGCGFSPQLKSEGIGLKNIASRTKAMKGRLKIESQINQGTKIKIQVPV